jgi:glycosyltransferase involved in cell wall biosynthesis
VTVGVPVYNGAATLRRAVESILRQTFPGCAIHISDNASTDDTALVGEALAAEHGNVTYTRHGTSLGLSGNFRWVLQQARTPYFMWLAADDYIEPTYVERTLSALESNPDWVACVSRVRFIRPDGETLLARGTYPLLADRLTNLARFLSDPTDNARSYALHRTAALQTAFPPSHFHAFDWAAAAGTLLHGRHGEIEDVLMVRDETPSENYVRSVRRDNRRSITRLFPLMPMTADILFRQKVPIRPQVLKALLYINVEKHLEYTRLFHPRYASLMKPVWNLWRRHVAWRLCQAERSG